MISSPKSYIYDRFSGDSSDQLLLFFKQRILCRDGQMLWRRDELDGYQQFFSSQLLVRSDTGGEILAVDLLQDLAATLGAQSVSLRQLLMERDNYEFRLAGLSSQLINWYQNHRFCGACGAATTPHDRDRALVCGHCHTIFYPRINPCVIVLVTQGRKILLARHLRSPAGFFSCLAGFIEAGETPEETVVREVREEVGLDVADINYVGSQSWPFPSQLMLGFHARFVGGEIRIDEQEVSEAGWFDMDQLPQVPSASVSVAGRLIELYRQSARG